VRIEDPRLGNGSYWEVTPEQRAWRELKEVAFYLERFCIGIHSNEVFSDYSAMHLRSYARNAMMSFINAVREMGEVS